MNLANKTPATLYALARRAYGRGDAARALPYFQALHMHPKARDEDRLDALSGLAHSHFQLDHLDDALDCARALQRAGQRLGHRDAEADALVFIGQIALERGQERDAERALREVVATRGVGTSALYHANAWYFLARIAFERSRYADARISLDRAARIYRRIRRPGGLADVEIVRGHIAHVTGRLPQALDCARRARRLFDRVHELYGKAGAWHLEGEVHQALRQPRAAARVFASAAEVYRALGDPTNLATVLVQHADLLVSLGRYDEAVVRLDEAIAMLRLLDKPHRLGPVLLALAHARQMRGQVVEGLALQREAIEILVGAEADPVDIATAHRAEAETLAQLGRKPEARARLGRALEFLREFPHELETANVHLDLARLEDGNGADLTQQRAHLEAARPIFQRKKIWHALTQIDLIEAQARGARGNLTGALQVAGRALRRARQTQDPQGVANANSLRAALLARRGRTRAAEDAATEARGLFRRMRATWNRASLEADLASQHLVAGNTALAWSAARRALGSIEEVRAGAVTSPSLHADLVEAFRTAQKTALTVLRERADVRALVERVEATRGVTAAITRPATSVHGHARTRPPGRLLPPMRVGQEELEALLDGALAAAAGDAVTIAWYPEVRDGARDLLLVTPSHGAWFCTLVEPPGALATALGRTLEDPGALSDEAWRAVLDKVSATLLENPFARIVPLAHTRGALPTSLASALREHPGAPIDLVPHGWTGLVPWSALPLRHEVMVSPMRLGDRHLVRLRSRLSAGTPGSSQVHRPRRALVFGDDGSLLPDARAEATTIAELLRNAGVEVVEYGKDHPLSTAKLREEAARCDLLHLATHAEFNTASSWQSFIRLSCANSKTAPEVLSLEALLDFEAAPREVVLSACSTVAMDRARFFDTFSLAHGFLHAGSSVVVGTLWRVNDAATKTLMRRIYERRLDAREPVGFDEAVHATVQEAAAGRLQLPAHAVGESVVTNVTRGMLGSAVRRVIHPGSSPATWASLQVLVASKE